MGIIVKTGTLPSGIQVSNVYIGFGGEMICISPRTDVYHVTTYYRVFGDQTRKDGEPAARVMMQVTVMKPDFHGSDDCFMLLYQKLKQQFPNYIDCH